MSAYNRRADFLSVTPPFAMKLNVEPMPRRSWAEVVKNKDLLLEEEPVLETIVPAPRGARTALCRGELLVMLGHYGWIAPLQGIDHPEMSRHAGRIYLAKKDVRHGAVLQAGTEVAFYLYADGEGIGAEDCHSANEAACTQKDLVKSTMPHHQRQNRHSYPQQNWYGHASSYSYKRSHRESASIVGAPVILVRPEAAWFENSISGFTAPKAEASDASTSAGESSDTETPPGLVTKPWRRKSLQPMMAPPGLESAGKTMPDAVFLPPGLQLPSIS